MYRLKYSSQFKKDLKRFRNDKIALSELEYILDLLVASKRLPKKYHNHNLSGEFKNCNECHIRSDLLLIYEIHNSELLILLLRIGSHSELF